MKTQNMPSKKSKNPFRFAISLSVLNHLGRNLYRNFITVLGEAISNAWDADAKNVWITIDRDKSLFVIKDDGIGMTTEDFQNKFLKIGYSKRAAGAIKSPTNRPFIGAKGIGKLALLSCAKRISVFTKTEGHEYVGGVIDNSGLDQAIKDDLVPEEYELESLDQSQIEGLMKGHDHGTIVVFEDAKEQIKNSIAHIRKLIAMSFRFSILDEDFSIYVNGDKVSISDISDLLSSTEFTWIINKYDDDFVSGFTNLKSNPAPLTTALDVRGFIASVEKPRNLKITGTEERATIDLFVNGRLREKNILRHIPSQRIVESYLYGQLHFDSMDGLGKDPFTSSREGVVEDDENFNALLDYLKRDALPHIFEHWDVLRLDRGQEGDDENKRVPKKQRKALSLYSAAREEFEPPTTASNKDKVSAWLTDLQPDAAFNLGAYADCFLSENLLRRYIADQKVQLDKGAPARIKEHRDTEKTRMSAANVSFDISDADDDLGYLDMDLLALSVEGGKPKGKEVSLWNDAIAYKPVRNAVGHTRLLSQTAKNHLNVTRENITARVKNLVSKKRKK